MITLNEKQELIMMFIRDGHSIRSIAKLTKLHRSTVSKYIKQYEQCRQTLLTNHHLDRIEQIDIIDDMVTAPSYNSGRRRKRKVTSEIIDKVQSYLDENKQKRERGLAKQQKKKIDIHAALVADGFDIGYSTVKYLVNSLSQTGKEAFIRQEYEPGDICEFDWGEVKLFINGNLTKLQMAVFTSAKSNYRWAMLFMEQKTGSFLDAHVAFFNHVGGVYRNIVYDNMRVAVRKFVGLYEKEPTEALAKLSMYYGFTFRFCNVRAGNEKGHVERSVEYIRRKAFAVQDAFSSLIEANDYLASMLSTLNSKRQTGQEQTIHEAYEAEKTYLLPYMPPYETAKTNYARVSKYSTIMIDTCYYSVPDHLVGKLVFVKVYSSQLLCYYDEKLVATHSKKHGYQQWAITISHYCNTLSRKPGALRSSVALRQAEPFLQELYLGYYLGKERSFIELVQYCEAIGIEKVEEKVKQLKVLAPYSVTTEAIKTLCERSVVNFSTNKDENSEIFQCANKQLRRYGLLLQTDTGADNFEGSTAI